ERQKVRRMPKLRMTKGEEDVMSFFFFQAEDGIRDKLVTGVQTCALPISVARMKSSPSPVCKIRHTPSTYSGAYPQSRFASRLPRNNSFCRPCLIAATAREILRVTKVSP